MTKKITVYDIAKEIKLSPSTVSRVLNDSSLISNERTQQIWEVATRLGYQKRSIKRHVSRSILNIQLFIPSHLGSYLSYFFFNISEVIDELRKGFAAILLNFIIQPNDDKLEFLKYKKTSQIDACLFAFTRPSAQLQKQLEQRNIPFVLLNREAPDIPYVSYDIPQGIQLLAEAMYRVKGKELRPCYLAFSKQPKVSKVRIDAARDFFENYGIPFGPRQVFLLDSLEDTPKQGLEWVLKNQFNAVMALNDLVALSFHQAALSRGFFIPEDLLLSGFDDSPIQNLLSSQIDTVKLSPAHLAQTASIWLWEVLIEKKKSPLQQKLTAIYVPGKTISG